MVSVEGEGVGGILTGAVSAVRGVGEGRGEDGLAVSGLEEGKVLEE